jgi:hypothetical protein
VDYYGEVKTMSIPFTCQCGKELQARDEQAGTELRCPGCGAMLVVPTTRKARPDMDDDEETMPQQRVASGTSGKAIAALVLGIVSLCLPVVLPSILAIIFAVLGLKDISKSRGRLGGQAMAIIGLVLAIIGPVAVLPVAMIGVLVPAVQKVREAAATAQGNNNLIQIGLAMHNYHDQQGALPPAVVYDKDGKPLYSWRVVLLPYLGADDLYKLFKLDEPWDSSHNKALLAKMPKTYIVPEDLNATASFMTRYQVLDGNGAAFDSELRLRKNVRPLGPGGVTVLLPDFLARIPDFLDGTSNTILIAEADEPVPWTKPQDLAFLPKGPLPRFSQLRSRGFQVSMVDVSVRTIPHTTPESTIRALITRNGGEVVPPF